MKLKAVTAIVVAVSQVVSCAHNPGSSPTGHTVDYKTIPSQRSPSSQKDTLWTSWSEKSRVGALLELSEFRSLLLDNGLHDPHYDYLGYKQPNCKEVNTNYRQADGTCTDLENPLVGSAGTAFGRNVPPQFIDITASENLMTPNPALVSKEFFTRDEFKPVPFLNMIAAAWIQFMNHDWLSHGKNIEGNPYVIDGASENVKYIDRTQENPVQSQHYKKEYSKVTANEVTHWWDASQIYGSSLETVNALRSFQNGKMKTVSVNGKEILPQVPGFNAANNRQNQGVESTGFRDNWWLGLSLLHTLFVREHNKVAEMLYKEYVRPGRKAGTYIWTSGANKKFTAQELDEHIFQTARLINAAILAKIHTVEWTPAILPNPTLKVAMCANWYGLANSYCRKKLLTGKDSVPTGIKTDIFKIINLGHIVGGIIGDKTKNYGVPYSISEEFTSVYRLHSLLPENLELKTLATKNKVEKVPFVNTRNELSYGYMAHKNTEDLFYSFGTQLPGQLVLNNFPKFMQEFEVKGHNSMDLGMVDIVRDRERGVPRYNQFRRGIGLKPIEKYTDFFLMEKKGSNELSKRQQDVLAKFYKVYGKTADGQDNVEAVDLLVGTLSEEVRPKDFGFGETMFQIFILMASRRLMADRFFTESYNAKTYTKAGLKWIDNEGTLAQVIGRHMPELKPKMEGLWTAFQPWKD